MNGLKAEVNSYCKNVRLEYDNRLILECEKETIITLCHYLKKIGFDHVKGVTGVDYPSEEHIEVIYYLGSYSQRKYAGIIVELTMTVSRENPEVPSLINIWGSCEYPERETYEMLGVIFQGHPKLERLLLPEDLEGTFPLRKEFKIPEEGVEA